MELARRKVEQDRLVRVPAEPREHVEHAEQPEHGRDAQALEASADLARIDLGLPGVELALLAFDQGQRNRAVHDSVWGGGASSGGRQRRAVNPLDENVHAQNMKKPIV